MGNSQNLSFVWLSGLVFVDRNFVERIQVEGIDAVLENCPHDDLTEQEKKSFLQAMSVPRLQEAVRAWWKAYDQARETGELMSPATLGVPWGPYSVIDKTMTA